MIHVLLLGLHVFLPNVTCIKQLIQVPAGKVFELLIGVFCITSLIQVPRRRYPRSPAKTFCIKRMIHVHLAIISRWLAKDFCIMCMIQVPMVRAFCIGALIHLPTGRNSLTLVKDYRLPGRISCILPVILVVLPGVSLTTGIVRLILPGPRRSGRQILPTAPTFSSTRSVLTLVAADARRPKGHNSPDLLSRRRPSGD